MITDFDTWVSKADPQWNLPLCKKVGKYMIVPVDLDDTGNTVLAVTRKAATQEEAASLLSNIKILYTTMVVDVSNDDKSIKTTKEYLIRGVW